MRLCLVSSILALFVSIQFQSEQWLLVGLLTMMLFSLPNYSWQMRMVAFFCLFTSALYSHFWLVDRLQSRLPANLSGTVVTGYGEVIGCNAVDVNIEKLLLRIDSVQSLVQADDIASASLPELKRLAINYYRHSYKDNGSFAAMIPCGSQIKFKAKLRAPYGFINPAGFDYEAWQLSQKVDALGYLLSYELVGSSDDWCSQLLVLRQYWLKRAADLKGSAGQIVPALLFGESGFLARQHWLDFQLTGTIHLLIVSGLHVGFLALLVIGLWRILVRVEVMLFFPRSSLLLKITPVILLFACLLYAYMAGMGLAIQRAGLMLLVAILVVYYRHHWSLFDSWLWVMWLVLIINPLTSLFVGFWFSFAAVGCLLMSYSGQIGGAIKSKGQRFANKIKTLYEPQWVIFIALMPLLWLFQQSHSILSFFVNILAIPLLGLLILPLSLMAFIWPDGFVVELLNLLLVAVMGFLHQVAQQPSWQFFKPAGSWLLALVPMVLIALWLPGSPFKRLSLVLLFLVFISPISSSEKKIVVFDVGQGLAVYGRVTSGESWLYDTGAEFRSGFSLGEAVVAKNILAFTGRRLDLLFVSHSDNDHAGGELGLRRKIVPILTYAGQPRLKHHQYCHGINGWQPFANGADRWRVFDYSADKKGDNNHSCIVQIEVAGKKILLPGDIDKRAEAHLLKLYAGQLKSDILVVGHHGSRSSSSKIWLQQVAPKLAIVSSGFNNRFQHPHLEVINRFKQLSIPLYNTANSGAIEIDLSEDVSVIPSITQWRSKNPPIWRQM